MRRKFDNTRWAFQSVIFRLKDAQNLDDKKKKLKVYYLWYNLRD